jgi:hypothetical protein
MRNKRKHARFDLIEMQGEMPLANNVEIIDISLGGVALKADRRLEIGREYTIKLGSGQNSVDVRGVVVRCTLSGMVTGADGNSALIYAAGMKFKEGQTQKVASFIHSVPHRVQAVVSAAVEQRLTVRFQITAPQRKVLLYPEDFRVEDISLTSMLIQADVPLGQVGSIPLSLHLSDTERLDFNGRIFSSRMLEGMDQPSYETNISFSDLTDTDRTLLKKFINYLVAVPDMSKEE